MAVAPPTNEMLAHANEGSAGTAALAIIAESKPECEDPEEQEVGLRLVLGWVGPQHDHTYAYTCLHIQIDSTIK